MPNRNYIKGVKKERAIVNEYRDKGCIAFRSAGSHSPIDVCVIDAYRREIKLIQCKPDNWTELRKQKLKESLSSLNGFFEISFQII